MNPDVVLMTKLHGPTSGPPPLLFSHRAKKVGEAMALLRKTAIIILLGFTGQRIWSFMSIVLRVNLMVICRFHLVKTTN